MKKITIALLLIMASSLANAQTDKALREPITILYNVDGLKVPVEKQDSVIRSTHDFKVSKQLFGQDSLVIHLLPAVPKPQDETTIAWAAVQKDMMNKPAPKLEANDINGKNIALSKLKGKVVVLNFWFTSCPPCKAEIPVLNTLVNRYKGHDVVFLSVTFNNAKEVKTFLKSHPFLYKAIPGADKICNDFKIVAYPTHFVIDKKGYVKFMKLGGENISMELIKNIDALTI